MLYFDKANQYFSQVKRSQLVLHVLILVFSLLCMISFLGGYGIRYNSSASLKHKIYVSIPAKKIQIGDIVNFSLPVSPVKFAKKVSGLPGDFIEVIGQKLYINGIEQGLILKNLKSIKQGKIPPGYFFALGTHPESFDSRYDDFGLVPQSYIKEKLCPIF